MSNIEVLKQAIEALEENVVWFSTDTMIGRSLKEKTNKAIASLNQAIAELESQEPFTYYRHYDGSTQEWPDELTIPLYTHPPQRKPLTDGQIYSMVADITDVRSPYLQFARAIEAAHGIKE